MELLDRFDDDVVKEVARIKENIKDACELVSACKTEKLACSDAIPGNATS